VGRGTGARDKRWVRKGDTYTLACSARSRFTALLWASFSPRTASALAAALADSLSITDASSLPSSISRPIKRVTSDTHRCACMAPHPHARQHANTPSVQCSYVPSGVAATPPPTLHKHAASQRQRRMRALLAGAGESVGRTLLQAIPQRCCAGDLLHQGLHAPIGRTHHATNAGHKGKPLHQGIPSDDGGEGAAHTSVSGGTSVLASLLP
jgi:hypothetical protein